MWKASSKSLYSKNHGLLSEGRHSMDAVKNKLTHIPRIKWKCAPKFVLSHNWHVAAGEESEEVKIQRHREVEVPEAVYPHLSYIPPSPSPPSNMQEDHLDDNHIPVIPITPVEEGGPPQNASVDTHSLGGLQGLSSRSPNAPQCDHHSFLRQSSIERPAFEAGSGTQADVALAAATVLTALLKSKEHGSLIDADLLVKIFSDPQTIEKLISEQAALAGTNTKPVLGTKSLSTSVPFSIAKPCMVEELSDEHGALINACFTSVSGLGAAIKSVGKSGLKSDRVIRKMTDEYRAPIHIGTATFPISEPMKYPFDYPVPRSELGRNLTNEQERGAIGKGTAPVSGSDPLTSQFAFLNPRPDLVVNKSITESVMLMGAPLPSLHSSKPDVGKVKMTGAHGVHSGTGPISGSTLWTPEITTTWSPKEDFVFPARMNIYPLPNERETNLQLKAVLSDAVRPSLYVSPNMMHPDSQLKTVSPDAARLHVHSLPNQVKPSLQMSTPLPNQVHPSSQVKSLSPGSVQMSSFSSMASPSKDITYFKSLIRQHGEKQESRDYGLLQSGNFRSYSREPKLVPNLNPNELTMKIQRPCFLSRSGGCQNGSSCPYLHDEPQNFQLGSVRETQSAKRMKLGWEVSSGHR